MPARLYSFTLTVYYLFVKVSGITRYTTAQKTISMHPVTIDKPMILIPVEDYLALLEEAGYTPTPKLDREITQARKRFCKGKAISWETLKRELKQIWN